MLTLTTEVHTSSTEVSEMIPGNESHTTKASLQSNRFLVSFLFLASPLSTGAGANIQAVGMTDERKARAVGSLSPHTSVS